MDPSLIFDTNLLSEPENDDTAGIIVPGPNDTLDSLDTYAYPIADDILYNIVHSIVLKTHREERIARSLTAGISISQTAASLFPPKDSTPAPTPAPSVPSTPNGSASAPSTPKKKRSKVPRIVENDAALYDNGIITLKGNPLANVHEIRCPKCGKEKLLYPRAGVGARQPEEGKEYCARQPFVDLPGHDIYGLPFPRDDVAAPNVKKSAKEREKEARLLAGKGEGTDSSFEGGGANDESTPPPTAVAQAKVGFPNVSCPRCPRMVNVRVFAKHLNGHLRSGGRASGRAAAMKISGQSNDSASQKSRTSTPATTSNPNRSPQKRDREASDAGPERKRISLNLTAALNKNREQNGNSGGDKDNSRSERSSVGSSTDEKDRERARILAREKERQREREVLTNRTFAAAKKRWPEKVVKKWKSGKVTVDGRVWENRS